MLGDWKLTYIYTLTQTERRREKGERKEREQYPKLVEGDFMKILLCLLSLSAFHLLAQLFAIVELPAHNVRVPLAQAAKDSEGDFFLIFRSNDVWK